MASPVPSALGRPTMAANRSRRAGEGAGTAPQYQKSFTKKSAGGPLRGKPPALFQAIELHLDDVPNHALVIASDLVRHRVPDVIIDRHALEGPLLDHHAAGSDAVDDRPVAGRYGARRSDKRRPVGRAVAGAVRGRGALGVAVVSVK